MTEILPLEAVKQPPESSAVLASQGVPADAAITDRVAQLVESAREIYTKLTAPQGLWTRLLYSEFEPIYNGEGQNEKPTPLEEIAPQATQLALFAVTLGEPLSREIADLFARNEPALGYMLDAVASERAETAAELLAGFFLAALKRDELATDSERVLPYSPGYCGWHITGQRRLFAKLQPERIGITINSSCLMQPLKSVSGVLVAGVAEIHRFDNTFNFCDDCATHDCRARIASLS